MTCYCTSCNKFTDYKIQNIKEVFNVKGEDIEILSDVAVCTECGAQNFQEELDSQNLNQAYVAYRKNHNLLSPENIETIRKKYALSQRSLSKLLGWGDITIHRYESGSIQDNAHNQMLQMVEDPKNMRKIFEQNKSNLHEIVRERLRKRLEQLITEDCSQVSSNCVGLLETYWTSQVINEYSGFVKFEVEKLINMIVYIINKTNGDFETKLNKLLWYSDFLYFKKYSKSISGCAYVHLPHGPCPNNYELVFAAAINDKYIIEEEIFFPSGDSGTVYKALVSPDLTYFIQDELKALDFVINYFQNLKAKEISEKSHDEKGYIETMNSQVISYKYAKELSLSLS